MFFFESRCLNTGNFYFLEGSTCTVCKKTFSFIEINENTNANIQELFAPLENNLKKVFEVNLDLFVF